LSKREMGPREKSLSYFTTAEGPEICGLRLGHEKEKQKAVGGKKRGISLHHKKGFSNWFESPSMTKK